MIPIDSSETKQNRRNEIPQLNNNEILYESYFNELFYKSPYAIAILDLNYKIIDINSNFTKLFKYHVSEIKGCTPKEAIHPYNLDEEMNENIELITNKGLIEKETFRRDKLGNILRVELFSYPIFNNQRHVATYAIYQDITEQRKIQERTELLAKVLENNTEGVFIVNQSVQIEWVNKEFTKITGYSHEEVIGKNPRMFQSGKHDQNFYKELWQKLLKDGYWSGEIWNKNKKGQIYPQWIKIFILNDHKSKATHYAAIINDISEKKLMDERVKNLIYKDSLTGLYNRSYMKDRIDLEIQNMEKSTNQIAVIFCDIDNFKNINDNLGHSMGDIVIKEFGKKLIKSFPEKSVIGRIGGDEFIIVIPNLDDLDKEKLFVQEILEPLRKPCKINNQEFFITSSFGVSIYPDNGLDSETLIKNADIAMYKAKESKNRLEIYNEELNSNIEEQFVINNNLNKAILNKELTIHYQPIIQLNTMAVIGAEALIRWNHPQIGYISPEKFIPIAEKSGPIHEIGRWVLTEACRQNKEWQQKGLAPIVVSVNVSVKQLEESYFPQMVSDILNDINLAPNYLELEITESVSGRKNYDKIVNNLRKSKQLGIKISLDDFGTGYSSLGKIKELEISKLKIDRSFISDIKQKANYDEIVLAILAMAKRLKLKVVSEGIETSEQLKFLSDHLCDLGQGYLFSKPLEKSEFEKYLTHQSICSEINNNL